MPDTRADCCNRWGACRIVGCRRFPFPSRRRTSKCVFPGRIVPSRIRRSHCRTLVRIGGIPRCQGHENVSRPQTPNARIRSVVRRRTGNRIRSYNSGLPVHSDIENHSRKPVPLKGTGWARVGIGRPLSAPAL